MSTTKYYPNGEGTNPVYDIGTIGWQYNKTLLNALDGALAVTSKIPGMGTSVKIERAVLSSVLGGLVGGDGAYCPNWFLDGGELFSGYVLLFRQGRDIRNVLRRKSEQEGLRRAA